MAQKPSPSCYASGIELAKRIREELPQTKIILMSSYTEDA